MLLSINYHYIRHSFDALHPSIFGVTPDQFSAQLDELGSMFEFVGSDQINGSINGTSSLPNNACCITFDDGLKEQYALAWPILESKGIPAIFHINTQPIQEKTLDLLHKNHILRSMFSIVELASELDQFVAINKIDISKSYNDSDVKSFKRYDPLNVVRFKFIVTKILSLKQQRVFIDYCYNKMLGPNEEDASTNLYMDPEMIQILGQNGCIGVHGHSHTPFDLLTNNELIFSIDTCIETLNLWGADDINAVSYPYGIFNKNIETISQRSGISFGFTMDRVVNSKDDMRNNPMSIARFNPNDIPFGGKFNSWEKLLHR